MNVLALDCEFNQPSGKTIQIGAAVYKASSGLLVEKFETYVNPGEPINQDDSNGITNIVKLTGITDRDVQNAPTIQEAYLRLKALHRKHKCFRNPIVWGSGVRNDSQHIHEEAAIKDAEGNLEENFMGYRVIDAKGLFQSVQIFHNGTVRGGLKNTCEELKIGFEGTAHTALADAMNTFRVWHYLTKRFQKDY